MFRTLRPLDLASLVLVMVMASTGVTSWLGLTDRLSVIALTMGLTCPAARRLIAWRRGAEPLRLGNAPSSTALILLAMLPWIVIPGLRTMPWTAVAELATLRIELPFWIRVGGTVLAIAGVLKPMLSALRGTDRIRSSAHIETVGLFIATGSVVLFVMAAAWLALTATAAVPALNREPAGRPVPSLA